MKKILSAMVLLMLCIGSTAQDKLFEEGIARGRAAKQFYYAKNGKGKGMNLNKFTEYARKNNYLIGYYTTKEIDRFGDKETAIDEVFFLPKNEYPQFVYEFVSNSTSLRYDDLKQTGSCWLYESGSFTKLDNVKWSGTVENGLITGKGTAFIMKANNTIFYFISGEFQHGLPLGRPTIDTYYMDDSKPSSVTFRSATSVTVGELSENLAKFQNEIGKWGFVTSDGRVVISPKYDSVIKDFKNGRAEVVLNNVENIISNDGTYIDLTANQKQLNAAQAAKERQEELKREQEKRNKALAERQKQIERERQEAEAERIRVEKFKNCQPGDIIYYSQSYEWEEGIWIFTTSHSASWRVVCYVEQNINNGERLKILVGDVETSGDRYKTPKINGIEFRKNDSHYIKPLQDKNWHIE